MPADPYDADVDAQATLMVCPPFFIDVIATIAFFFFRRDVERRH